MAWYCEQNINNKSITFAKNTLPAYETGEYTVEQNHLCIYVGQPLVYEQLVKGKLRSHNCIYGDMVLYPAGMRQNLAWNKKADIIELDISPQFISQISDQLSTASTLEFIPQYNLRDSLLQQLALTLVTQSQTGDSNRLYIDSLSHTLALHLIEKFSQSSIVKNITGDNSAGDGLPRFLERRLDEYIQENIDQNLTLQQMADVVNLSVSHLNRLFKQSRGISLYQYVIRCRIDRSQELLKSNNMTIAEIASQVGFCDQSHFSHHFKKLVGVTPKAFRQIKS